MYVGRTIISRGEPPSATLPSRMAVMREEADLGYSASAFYRWPAAMPLLAGPTAARLASSPFLTNLMSRVPPATPLTSGGRRAAGLYYPTIGGLLGQ
jgi:hypothetical protein